LGDIFHQNCFKNGLLPVILQGSSAEALRHQLHEAPGAAVTVDLLEQTVTAPDGTVNSFEVDPFRRQMLLTGRDEIALTLGHEAALPAFEPRPAREMRWLFPECPASQARGPSGRPPPSLCTFLAQSASCLLGQVSDRPRAPGHTRRLLDVSASLPSAASP